MTVRTWLVTGFAALAEFLRELIVGVPRRAGGRTGSRAESWAVALAPPEPRHHRELAEVRAAVGRWSRAIESYNRALHLEPGLEAARVGFTDPVPVNVGGLHDGSGYPARDAETSR